MLAELSADALCAAGHRGRFNRRLHISRLHDGDKLIGDGLGREGIRLFLDRNENAVLGVYRR